MRLTKILNKFLKCIHLKYQKLRNPTHNRCRMWQLSHCCSPGTAAWRRCGWGPPRPGPGPRWSRCSRCRTPPRPAPPPPRPRHLQHSCYIITTTTSTLKASTYYRCNFHENHKSVPLYCIPRNLFDIFTDASPPLLLSLSSYCCCSCAPSSRPSRRSEPRLRSRSALLANQRWAPRSRDPLSTNHSSPALPVPVVALVVVQRLARGPELSVKLLLHLQSLDLFPQHLQHHTRYLHKILTFWLLMI